MRRLLPILILGLFTFSTIDSQSLTITASTSLTEVNLDAEYLTLDLEDGETFIGFEILETLDKATNPDFPMVMPVTTDSTTLKISLSELVLGGESGEIPDNVTAQSVIISSFTTQN